MQSILSQVKIPRRSLLALMLILVMLVSPSTLISAAATSSEDEAPVMIEVTVTADGKTTCLEVPKGSTAQETLDLAGIFYDEDDQISPKASRELRDGSDVVLRRVEWEEYTVEEVVPYRTYEKETPLLEVGNTKLVQEGKDGLAKRTYGKPTIDGEPGDPELLEEKIEEAPVDEVLLVGSNDPVSPLDFGVETDENGVPTEYSKVLTDQVATGYSAYDGARTASGREATAGHVAVNPNEIPYGSRLYITSSDGEFVYGYAVAADTGTGLLYNVVDVDLFYDTYAESVLNGRRTVDIYLLDGEPVEEENVDEESSEESAQEELVQEEEASYELSQQVTQDVRQRKQPEFIGKKQPTLIPISAEQAKERKEFTSELK